MRVNLRPETGEEEMGRHGQIVVENGGAPSLSEF